jgi:recombination protein RecA
MAGRKKAGDTAGATWESKWASVLTAPKLSTEARKVLSTGSPTLDIALGHGGLPVGHLTRIYGRKGSCKTTLMQALAVRAINQGYNVYWLDTETGFEPDIAAKNGVPMDDDRFSLWSFDPEPPDGSPPLCYETMSTFLTDMMNDTDRNPNGCVFIIDSLSAIRARAHLTAEIDDTVMMKIAALNAAYFPMLMPRLKRTNSTLVCLQQMRAVANAVGYAETENPGGGYALQHYAHVEIKLQNIHTEPDGTGNTIKFTIRANRTNHAGLTGNFYMDYRYGINYARELIELGIDNGTVKKGGAWYRVSLSSGDKQWQGVNAACEYLYANLLELTELESMVMTAQRNG